MLQQHRTQHDMQAGLSHLFMCRSTVCCALIYTRVVPHQEVRLFQMSACTCENLGTMQHSGSVAADCLIASWKERLVRQPHFHFCILSQCMSRSHDKTVLLFAIWGCLIY